MACVSSESHQPMSVSDFISSAVVDLVSYGIGDVKGKNNVLHAVALAFLGCRSLSLLRQYHILGFEAGMLLKEL